MDEHTPQAVPTIGVVNDWEHTTDMLGKESYNTERAVRIYYNSVTLL